MRKKVEQRQNPGNTNTQGKWINISKIKNN